jgi:GTPase SAR1 family protein
MNTCKVSICILGDSYSSKSTFLNYTEKGFFEECYHVTIGVEFLSISYIFENNVLNYKVILIGNKNDLENKVSDE